MDRVLAQDQCVLRRLSQVSKLSLMCPVCLTHNNGLLLLSSQFPMQKIWNTKLSLVLAKYLHRIFHWWGFSWLDKKKYPDRKPFCSTIKSYVENTLLTWTLFTEQHLYKHMTNQTHLSGRCGGVGTMVLITGYLVADPLPLVGTRQVRLGQKSIEK